MSGEAQEPGAEFWDYAVACWSRKPVRDLLLHWQNRRGADMIPILFACWLPWRLPPAHWRELTYNSRKWNLQVTRRIRSLRRRIPASVRPELPSACGALELAAERLEAAWLGNNAQSASMSSPAEPPDRQKRLRRLFPELPDNEVRELLAYLGLQ